jgi:hypothetical protein
MKAPLGTRTVPEAKLLIAAWMALVSFDFPSPFAPKLMTFTKSVGGKAAVAERVE